MLSIVRLYIPHIFISLYIIKSLSPSLTSPISKEIGSTPVTEPTLLFSVSPLPFTHQILQITPFLLIPLLLLSAFQSGQGAYSSPRLYPS